MTRQTVQIDTRGQLVIPKEFRTHFQLRGGSLLLIEETKDGILLRPAKAVPVEIYTPLRKASLLLDDAVDAKSYAEARRLVTEMGLNPDEIPHDRPGAAGPTKSVP